MSSTQEMLDSHPQAAGSVDLELLAACIDACLACGQACTACADACLAEEGVADLVKCIRTDLDCADLCETTASILSRRTGHDANLLRTVLETCAQACNACAEECQSHAEMHDHCRICAEACRACEEACKALAASNT